MSVTRDLGHAQEVTVPTSPLCHRLIPRLALRDLVNGDAVPAKGMRLVAALFDRPLLTFCSTATSVWLTG